MAFTCHGLPVPATSALFREQASADLALAQMIPRRDLSGQFLGLSTFLAQQCIEKQIKAIMLKINEVMEIEKSDKFLHVLSHKLYPNLHVVRESFVRDLGFPPDPVLRIMGRDNAEHAFARIDRIIKRMGNFWAEYAGSNPPIYLYLWKNSLHVELPPKELVALNEFFHNDLIDLASTSKLDVGDLPKEQFSNKFSPPAPMRDVIRDESETKQAYANYKLSPSGHVVQVNTDWHLALWDLIFSDATLKRLGRLPSCEQRRAVRRIVVEVGFEAACAQAYRYILLFPHNTLGRYPKLLSDGKSTVDIYESRADIVLHQIYNETRLDFEMMCKRADKLDELCRLGHEHGYW